ncbi:MAG TPA: MFS transporter, partial [Acidimicrobiales bacterium]|nr:MFS transporter [Acidimicrobiales bacterium]
TTPAPGIASTRRRPPAWSAAGLLVAAGLFRASQNMAITTFPLLGREELHLGAAFIGGLGTVIGVTGIAATLAVGSRVSSAHATTAVAAGTAVLLACLLVFGTSTSTAQFVVAAVLLGAAGGATTPSLATAIGRAPAPHRDRALARYALVLSVSLAAGPLVETATLALGGQRIRLPFFVFAALPVSALALGLVPARRSRPDRPEAPGETPATAATDEPLRQTRGGRLSALLSTRGGRLALTAQLLYAAPFSAVTVFGALVARDVYGTSAAGAQLSFTAFFVASLASRALIARFSPITAKLRLFGLCAALTVVGLALLALGGPKVDLFVAMALLGVPHGVTFPLALALTADASPPEHLAAANATLFAINASASVVAPVVLGAVATAAGYQVMMAAVLAPVALFAALLAGHRQPAAAA